MAITRVGIGTGSAGSGTTPTSPGLPAGAQTGDLIVYPFIDRGAATLTTPTSWTRQLLAANGAALQLAIYTRVYDGAFTVPAIVRSAQLGWLTNTFALRGVDTTTNDGVEVVGTASANATSTTSIDIANGITTLTNGAWVIGFGARDNDWAGGGVAYTATTNVNTLGTVSGVVFGEEFEAATTAGSDMGLVVDDGEKTTAGAVAASSFTFVTAPATGLSIGVYLAVKPAGAAVATAFPFLRRSHPSRFTQLRR